MTDWVTHEEIDRVAEALSASDVIAATADGGSGSQLLYGAFCHAANRLGHEGKITDRIRPGDYKYLSGKLSEVFDFASPLSDGGGA